MLERQAEELDKSLENERQRVKEVEDALSMISCELESKKLNLSDILEKYSDLMTHKKECGFAESMAATAFDTGRVEVDSPKLEPEQRFSTDRDFKERSMFHTGSSKEKHSTICLTKMPAFPEPAILRPALASVTTCQIEISKARGCILPASRVNVRSPLCNFLRWLSSNPLHLLY